MLGTTSEDATEFGLFPILLVATTMKVYETPFVSDPEAKVQRVVAGFATTQVAVPGLALTLKPVIAAPPVGVPRLVQETDADVFPGTAVTAVGAFGGVAQVIVIEP